MKPLSFAQLIGSLVFVSYFWWCVATPAKWHFVDFVNLIFHEAGHTITFFLPSILTALAGSMLQILIPAACAFYFYQRGELLSTNLLCLWVAQNILSVSVYVRDALPMNLTLLGGDYATHDWNYILGQLGLLQQSAFIADCLVLICYLIMVFSTATIGHYLYYKLYSRAV
jgi:hypothetical protein